MKFREDIENEGSFWIDREEDCRVDHFDPCDVCTRALNVEHQLGDESWVEFELCPDCEMEEDIDHVFAKINDERLYSMDYYPELPPDLKPGDDVFLY